MSIVNDMSQKVQEFASENATTLLTAGGVVGTVATAVLAGRAGFKAQQIIHEREMDPWVRAKDDPDGPGVITEEEEEISTFDKVKMIWPQFIPPVITGGATVTAIIFANRMSAQKAAALAAAYGLSQKQFEEYRTKVAEKLTGPKKEQIDAELAQERVNRAGPSQIVIVEGGDVHCFDQPSGRYFKSTMEKVNRAVNRTNEEMLGSEGVSLNFFYEELGLPPTTWGDQVGWRLNDGGLLELDISTVLSPEDEKPVLAIDFKKMPTPEYMGRVYE